ncbi:bifunctional folylpolyglutamate synthase/dihydrofolate synthase [Desulfovibrio sp. OttesenSCG-928-I05]|nr:bifunctional folylpolyglutamate synthase/dihydrofolate synthase [Desulfovibrio sp. OttesenSCG-928-I05]
MHTETPYFRSFEDLSRHLDERGFFRIEPGLERISMALSRFGLENPPFFMAQVVGTNGKGSTSTFLASIARAHGLKTGLYTSPHFVSIRERVRINGAMLSEDEWVALGNEAVSACPDLTYFEFTTAVAVLAFQKAGVDLAVMEAGLGGSWDATTAIRSDMNLFAPIDIDHAGVLGTTIHDIARDKAGAIREKTPVFTAKQSPEAEAELRAASSARHAPFHITGGMDDLPEAIRNGSARLGIDGSYQGGNAALALNAWRYAAERLHVPANPEAELRGLTTAFIPGRLQFIPARAQSGLPAMLLDGAHNPHGLAGLGKTLAEQEIAPCAVIFSCLADKDVSSIIPHLRIMATGPLFIPPIEDNPRAMNPEDLARAIGGGAHAVASLSEALEQAAAVYAERFGTSGDEALTDAKLHPVLFCGSLYLLGQFFSMYPAYLEQRTFEEV